MMMSSGHIYLTYSQPQAKKVRIAGDPGGGLVTYMIYNVRVTLLSEYKVLSHFSIKETYVGSLGTVAISVVVVLIKLVSMASESSSSSASTFNLVAIK